MGRETKNFRSTGRSKMASPKARSYAGVNRSGYFGKIVNFFKKGGYYGKG